MFVDQLAGLPNEDDLEREIAAAVDADRRPRASLRCRRGSRASPPAGSSTTAGRAAGTGDAECSIDHRGSGRELSAAKLRLIQPDAQCPLLGAQRLDRRRQARAKRRQPGGERADAASARAADSTTAGLNGLAP